jgi:hypothetical protein
MVMFDRFSMHIPEIVQMFIWQFYFANLIENKCN